MVKLHVVTVFLVSLLLTSQTGEAELLPTETSDGMHLCGTRLLEAAGKTGTGSLELPRLYWKASVEKDVEFMQYLYAVIYVESKFNKMAVSPVGARGLMQMTGIAIIEAGRRCSNLGTGKNMHDSYTNVRYGSCYLKYAYEATGSWREALIMYNGGMMQLQKYRRGDSIATETADYYVRVEQARDLCIQGANNLTDTAH